MCDCECVGVELVYVFERVFVLPVRFLVPPKALNDQKSPSSTLTVQGPYS